MSVTTASGRSRSIAALNEPRSPQNATASMLTKPEMIRSSASRIRNVSSPITTRITSLCCVPPSGGSTDSCVTAHPIPGIEILRGVDAKLALSYRVSGGAHTVVRASPRRGVFAPISSGRHVGPPRSGAVEAVFREEDERRLDAAAHILGLGKVELGEDRVHVLLDGSFGEHERLGDRAVALAARDLGEQLALA